MKWSSDQRPGAIRQHCHHPETRLLWRRSIGWQRMFGDKMGRESSEPKSRRVQLSLWTLESWEQRIGKHHRLTKHCEGYRGFGFLNLGSFSSDCTENSHVPHRHQGGWGHRSLLDGSWTFMRQKLTGQESGDGLSSA